MALALNVHAHEKGAGFDGQRISKSPKCFYRGIARTALKIADVTALHPSFERKLLLGEALELPVFAHVRAKKLYHIHAGM